MSICDEMRGLRPLRGRCPKGFLFIFNMSATTSQVSTHRDVPAFGRFRNDACRAAGIWPSSTPLDTPCRMPMDTAAPWLSIYDFEPENIMPITRFKGFPLCLRCFKPVTLYWNLKTKYQYRDVKVESSS
jgi:hypothetical protein